MKIALIIGISGQDGYYLSEFLNQKGYCVHGTTSRKESIDSAEYNDALSYIHWADLSIYESLSVVIRSVRPDEIYNLGTYKHGGLSHESPLEFADICGLGSIRILQILHSLGANNVKFFQASSSEIFGNSEASLQSIDTKLDPISPYGASKALSFHYLKFYRRTFGLFACSGILFNHESSRRGHEYVTRKITSGLCKVHLGIIDTVMLGNLEVKRDWGHAKDYVEAMWIILQQPSPGDYIIASGMQYSLKDFIEQVCNALSMQIEWSGTGLNLKGIEKDTKKVIVAVNPKYFRPMEINETLGDSRPLQDLGWQPKFTLDDIIQEMVEHEIETLTK